MDLAERGMRLKHEIRQVEAPHTLILSNNSTREIDDIIQKSADSVSPETLSHRLQQGWQHLQECPDPYLSNTNNNNPLDFNDNNNPDDALTVASSAQVESSFADRLDYRAMSSDDSGSSSEDESSATYSDTSPLLDVSSLGNSEVSLASDMSEDSSSSTSSSSSSSSGSSNSGAGNVANNNNNNNDGEEEEEDGGAPSMQSSWMSFSSAASSPSVAGPSSRGHVILPDVLPVGKVSRDDDDPMSEGSSRNLEITFEKMRPNQETSSSSASSRDCCLVEITTQPDIQVDIRLNPAVPSRMSVKHGNTYPREAKGNKRYLKSRDSTWIVNDSFEDDAAAPRCWALGEGIRLNNFTIVNGFKTLSLTELVKPNTNAETETTNRTTTDNSRFQNGPPKSNAYQNFERNYSKLPANVHMCCKDNRRFQNGLKPKPSVDSSSKCGAFPPQQVEIEARPCPQKPSRCDRKEMLDKSKQNVIPRLSNRDDNCNKFLVADKLPPKPKDSARSDVSSHASKMKPGDSKLSSPELFEVYTMETALPHINWAAISKASRESDWIRKRRNDREEIRRKLAMDSDTEDYISEKLSQHRENGSSFDRLKGSGNLQICFMNEAAKDQDIPPNSESSDEVFHDKSKTPMPRIQKPTLQLPSSNLPKCDKGVFRTQNNNNSPLSVTKRQRPKFFFNRPRSWHAAKPEENPYPEEDLLTRHIRLQAEAREALAQAKDMARMQMEIERQKKKKSPIAEMVGLPFPDGRNLLSHHALVAMNVAQLQVIVNDLHSQIETLNEDLVKFLLERDDLHMEQDSMLVDIEDLTRYLGLKGTNCVTSTSSSLVSTNSCSTNNKKVLKTESVRRSQSVHLKSKNLMWPLHQLALFGNGCSRR